MTNSTQTLPILPLSAHAPKSPHPNVPNTQNLNNDTVPNALENFKEQVGRAKAALFLLFVSLVCFLPFFYTGHTIGLLDIQPFWIRGVLGVGCLSFAFSLFFFVWYALSPQKIERTVVKDLVGNIEYTVPIEPQVEYQIKKVMIENKLLLLCLISVLLFILNLFIAYTQTYHSEKIPLDFSKNNTYQSMFRVARPEMYNIEIEIEPKTVVSSSNASMSAKPLNFPRTQNEAFNLLCHQNSNEWSEEQRALESKYKCSPTPLMATLILANEKEILMSRSLQEPVNSASIITPTLRRLDTLRLEPGTNYHYSIAIESPNTPALKAALEKSKVYALIEPTYTTQLKNLTTQKWYRHYWRISVIALVLNVLALFYFLLKNRHNRNIDKVIKTLALPTSPTL